MAGAGLRIIGTNVSPSLGYRDTPALNLTSASPLPGAPPTPIPAGTYDVALNYSSRANAQCQNSSHLTPSAFLIQVFRHPKTISLVHELCRKHLSVCGGVVGYCRKVVGMVLHDTLTHQHAEARLLPLCPMIAHLLDVHRELV